MVGRGRTHLRDDTAVSLGLPDEISEVNPDEPIDRPVSEVLDADTRS